MLWFKLMTMFEAVHPLEDGAFRRKSRRERRHGLPLVSPFVFYPRYIGVSAMTSLRLPAARTRRRSAEAGPITNHQQHSERRQRQ